MDVNGLLLEVAGFLNLIAGGTIPTTENAKGQASKLLGKIGPALSSLALKIVINLTIEQAEKLLRILTRLEDEGPPGEGWASPEVRELGDLVEAAIAAAASGG